MKKRISEMPRYLLPQPKHKYAIFSSIINKFIVVNMPYDFCLEYIMKDNLIDKNEAKESIKRINEFSGQWGVCTETIKRNYGNDGLLHFKKAIKNKDDKVLMLVKCSGNSVFDYKEVFSTDEVIINK